MGMKYKEVGGGPATGLADNFVNFLQQGMQTGSFGGGTAGARAGGADPFGSTMGIGGVLNDLLAGGSGKVGGSMNEMIAKQGERDAMALRARFGVGGGSAFGTPGAYAEALLRSETAPKMIQAGGGLQLQALQQLLPMFAMLSGKGIAQREGVMQPSPWMDVAKLGLQGAGAAAGFMAAGPGGAAAGSQMGANLIPSQPNALNFHPQDFSQMFQYAPPSFAGSNSYSSGGNYNWMNHVPQMSFR